MGDARNKTVHYKPLGFLHMGKILQLAKFFSITNTFNPYTPNKNFDHYHIQFSFFFLSLQLLILQPHFTYLYGK